MATFLCKTYRDSSPNGKPRVYFTCHPDDFEKHFEKICADIFKTHDCAIYYTEDMTEEIADQDKETELGRMNLFVVPVTNKLLTKPNRAIDDDLAYAKQKEIPVLPFMMEAGLDKIYATSDRFGERQYINPYSTDITEIRYEDKLKKYLESVLISDEMAKRVRAAFDAYIFLSYRKKDRRYANELMRLIHKNEGCRDIAIWYDEFLTPGESFRENIQKAMKDSKLFTLLVTPSLLERTPDGKKNFVMEQEYPAACQAKMPILPAEMVKTDRAELLKLCDDISADILPPFADPTDEAAFRDRFLNALNKVAIAENDSDPEHNFLIGLAYLNGIDVEVNRERGIALITSAAKADLLEAMEKLVVLHEEQLRYDNAIFWAKKIVEHYQRLCVDNPEEFEPELANSYGALGSLYRKTQRYAQAGEAFTTALEIQKRLSERNPDAFESDLATLYRNLGALYLNTKRYEQAEKALNAALEIQKRLSKQNPDAFEPDLATSYNNLGILYKETQRYAQAEEAYNAALEIQKRLSERNPDAFEPNLAASYNNLGDLYEETQRYAQAEKLFNAALEIQKRLTKRTPGAFEPDLATSYNNLGLLYRDMQRYTQAEKALNAALEIRKRLSKQNPDAFEPVLATSYNNLGDLYEKTQRYTQAEKALNAALGIQKHLSERNPDAFEPNLAAIYNNLSFLYNKTQRYTQAEKAFSAALEIRKRLVKRNRNVFEPDLAESYNGIGGVYIKMGRSDQARKAYAAALDIYLRLEEKHPGRYKETITIIKLFL